MSATHQNYVQGLGQHILCQCDECLRERERRTAYWNQVAAQNLKVSEFKTFQRIRLKHLKALLGDCEERIKPDGLARAEEKAIKEFLGNSK